MLGMTVDHYTVALSQDLFRIQLVEKTIMWDELERFCVDAVVAYFNVLSRKLCLETWCRDIGAYYYFFLKR
jgi:hypothetical protein